MIAYMNGKERWRQRDIDNNEICRKALFYNVTLFFRG